HRFAGSKDRAAIAERVYVVLRRRNECAEAMAAETPRALVLGSLKVVDGLALDAIEGLCADGAHALGALSANERGELIQSKPPSRELWARLNYPRWLHDELEAAFGSDLERELAALNVRAPLDLRVNSLKAHRKDVLDELSQANLSPAPCAFSRVGVRIDSER